jgi:hypothetical protein
MNPNHPVTISVFDDSRHGHGQGVPTTWAALVKRLAEHREGEKDGSNFVPARFHPEPAKQGGGVRRTKARLVARTAVALDIEMNKGTGEIPLAFADAVAAVQRRGWAGVLYTSFNHTAELPRYRIVLPITSEVGHDLPAPEVVAEELGLTGVLDATKLGAASVFYAPRTTPDARAKHRAEEVSGEPIDADWLATKAGELKARQDAAKAELKRQHQEEARQRREARNAAGIDPGWSLIAQVRAHLDLREELIGHGYEPRENGRYLFPGSDTGVAGVQILDGDDGVQRAYSHHANDPLAPGNLPTGYAKALDVVDVIAVLDHGGDQKKALHTLAQRFGISEPRASAQDEFTAREPAGKNGKPGLLTLDDLEAQPDPTWLVDKLIPERSFGIVGGPAKSGKTF